MTHSPVYATKFGIGMAPEKVGCLSLLDWVQTGDGASGAGNKAIGFRSESTGWYLVSPGLLRFEVNGFVIADYTSTIFKIETPAVRLRDVGGAAAPSLAYTSDSNTGIFHGGADNLGFATGGVEAMRVDASQNVRIGGGTNNLTVSSAGAITLNGSSRVIKEIQIDIGSMSLVGGSVPALGLSGSSPVLLFDDTTAENVNMNFVIPDDIDLTVNPILRVTIAPAAAQSTGSDFATQFILRYIDAGEELVKAIDETLNNVETVSNNASTVFIYDVTLNASLMTIGDLVGCAFARAATSGSDDRNGDMALAQICFRYTSNKIGG